MYVCMVHSTIKTRGAREGHWGSFPTTPPYSLRQGLCFESRALIFSSRLSAGKPQQSSCLCAPSWLGLQVWVELHNTPGSLCVCIGAGSESELRGALLVGKASLQPQVLAFKPPSRRDHPSLLGKAHFSQGLVWPHPLMGQYSSSISLSVSFFVLHQNPREAVFTSSGALLGPYVFLGSFSCPIIMFPISQSRERPNCAPPIIHWSPTPPPSSSESTSTWRWHL